MSKLRENKENQEIIEINKINTEFLYENEKKLK